MLKQVYFKIKTEYEKGRIDNKIYKRLSEINPLHEHLSKYIPEADILGCIHSENIALAVWMQDKRGFTDEKVALFNTISPVILREYINNDSIIKL